MQSLDESRSKERLPILILNAYNKYIKYGYPKDPAIYVIRASRKTFEKMKSYFDQNVQFLPKMEVSLDKMKIICEGYFFQLLVDDEKSLGEFTFGPELLDVKWKGV